MQQSNKNPFAGLWKITDIAIAGAKNSPSTFEQSTFRRQKSVTSNSCRSLHRSAYMGNNNDIRRTIKDDNSIVDYQDEYGFTALMAAASGGRTETVLILLEAGANPDLVDNNGITAMMCAIHRGHIDIVDALLEAGARTDILDNEGCNAYVCTARAGHPNILTLLLDHDRDLAKTTSALRTLAVDKENDATATTSVISNNSTKKTLKARNKAAELFSDKSTMVYTMTL